jgi:hypothetical protein
MTTPSQQTDPTALHTAEGDLRLFFVNLIKAGLDSTNEAAVARWRGEAMALRDGLRSRLVGLTDEAVHLDALWVQARGQAQEDALVRAEETVKPILQAKCLFTLPELMAPDFSFDAAAARIRISAATG